MTTRIKLRRDTAANWTSANPVLALGEAGYDTTNNQLRVGDGVTAWADLDVIGGGQTFTNDSLILPALENIGWNWNYTLNGPTLRIQGENTFTQAIVTGPVPNQSHPHSERIVIQGQRGYGYWGQNTAGEGGDVYIWAGTGGESDNNGGGSGGDIKLRGGQGQNNEGGYIKIEAGNAAHWNPDTSTGNGGWVEITAGSIENDSGNVNNRGGDITITAGRAFNASTQSGHVSVITGGTYNNGGSQYTWTFENDGTFAVPNVIMSQNYELDLAVNRTSYDLGRYLRLRDGDVESHIHLDSPDNSVYDLILGDDSKFVRVDHTGTVVVGTYGNSQNTWTFQTSGSIINPVLTIDTLPDPAVAGQRAFISDGESSPAFGDTVSTTGTNVQSVWSDGSVWKYG